RILEFEMVHIVRRLLKLRSQFAAAILPCLVVLLVFTSAAQTPATTGVESIRAEELRQKLTYIASDKFKGRGNGTPELDMAGGYTASVFEKNGLKPVGDRGTYYQHFQVYPSRVGQNNSLRIRGAGDATFEPKLSADFIPELWSVSGTVNGPLALIEDNRPADSSLKG